MTALAAPRNTPRIERNKRVFPLAANTKIYAGAMVALNVASNAAPVSSATGLKGVGRAEATVDNSTGAAGALSIEVRLGTFRFENSAAADLITRADIGADAYGVDDQTVAKTSASNTRSVVGKIHDVDAQGVWVTFS